MGDLVPTNELANALGFHSEAPDYLSTPRARLAQGLTPEVLEGLVQAGQWILPGGQAVSEIVGTIVGVRRTRALWDRTSNPATIVCRSDDGTTGVGTPGGACAECPQAEWSERGCPPECTLLYEYLIVTQGTPVVVTMSTRSASATIGQLNLAIRAKGQVNVMLRSQLVIKGSKRYYVPAAQFEW